jgi:hypothetical protein
MLDKILGPNANANLVALGRNLINLAIVAVLGGLQTALQPDGELGSYAWAPFALVALTQMWGFLDHKDENRPG